jgi:hypothetical protein
MNALSDLDDACANSPRCAWLMKRASALGIFRDHGWTDFGWTGIYGPGL